MTASRLQQIPPDNQTNMTADEPFQKSYDINLDVVSGVRKPLMEKEPLSAKLLDWGGKVGFFLSATLVVYLIYAYFAFDWDNSAKGFFTTVLSTDLERVGDAIGGYVELLAAILGIIVTVVAIVLQLAAQRYGTRLVELFLADNINRAYFIFMVLSLLYAIVVIFAIKEDFFPQFAIEVLLFLTLLEISLLTPYFLFVFKFLTPTNLLSSIQEKNKISLSHATRDSTKPVLEKYQGEVSNALEQVTDSALSAVNQMDRNLGLMAINQIREMILDYLDLKYKLPQTWFRVPSDYFISISSEFYEEICENRLWVEAKCFMDMDLIFKNSIAHMPDAISAIAYNTRIIGEYAIKNKDDHLLDMAIKYYNTFIRVSLNNKNQRSIFVLFYQYRLLTESIFDYDPDQSEKILRHFKYYGEECLRQGIPFVMVNAAFDLGGLVATAHDKNLNNIKNLLRIFMAIEDAVDPENMYVYANLRYSQLILAAYLLSKGDTELLPIVVEDLKKETLAHLITWRDYILAQKDKKFFEITDRGYLFEYIDDNQKEYLKLFYEKYVLSQPELFKRA